MSATKAKPKSQSKSTAKGKGAARGKSKATKASGGAKPRQGTGGQAKRLRPGELDGLVLGYMREHEDELPLSPTRIAKAIKRSSGAVGNCLERLAKAKPPKARLAKKAPRAYDLKGVNAR